MIWVDLAARARGLASRLVPAPALDELDVAVDAAAAAAALARAGLPPGPSAAGPEPLEAELRARAAADLAVLGRWAGARAAALAVVLDDEDRRSLRAILRGLVAGVAGPRRLDGTVATPGLPAASLAQLAAAPAAADVAAVLARRGHPFAAALAPVCAHAPLDLLDAELALARAFAGRSRAATAADPGGALAVHVAQVLDAENAAAALLLAARGADLDPARVFLPGGRRVGPDAFAAAAAGPSDAARARLAAALAGTPLAAAIDAAAPGALEDAALAWHLATQARLRRLEPLGPAPVLWLVLARRVEAGRIRRARWRLALGGAS